jgi:hypothetical protein
MIQGAEEDGLGAASVMLIFYTVKWAACLADCLYVSVI